MTCRITKLTEPNKEPKKLNFEVFNFEVQQHNLGGSLSGKFNFISNDFNFADRSTFEILFRGFTYRFNQAFIVSKQTEMTTTGGCFSH